MKQWAKACAACNAYKIQDCSICINQSSCNDNKTGYCFLCADAMICHEREAAGMTYNADLKVWEGVKQMNKQCEICERTGCIGKQSTDKVCERCLHDIRKNWLKLCVDCATSCQFADKTQVRTVKNHCELCGATSNLEVHHLMRGSSREMADKYGYKICVCHDCHTNIHHNSELEMQLRRKAEQAHVDRYGMRDLIQKFGKSHL